jgi:serine/threonine-protein kinase
LAVATLVAGLVAGRVLVPSASTPPPAPVARFRIPVSTSQGSGIATSPVNTLALSPNGQTIVFVSRLGAAMSLYVRHLGELEPAPLPGTAGAAYPIFSPDGSRIAFFEAVWVDANSLATTGPDGGLILFGLDGVSRKVLAPDTAAGETFIGANAVLPDRRTVLAIPAIGTGVNGPIIAVDIVTGERTPVSDAVVNAVWYADGHILWSDPNGALFGARFDANRLRMIGQPVALADGVRLAVGGQAQVAVSANGSVVYIPEQPFNLALVDRHGAREIVADGRRFHNPRFSPDGKLLAVDFIQQGSRDVWTVDLAQRTLTRVTFENDGHDAMWLPDGEEIAYTSRATTLRRRIDGSGGLDSLALATPSFVNNVLEFTPDGKFVLASTVLATSFDVEVLPVDGAGERNQLLASPFNEESATLSPDGRWVAYHSNETGVEEVYVRSFPDGGRKNLVSQGGGREPAWSPRGDELFYFGQREGVPYLIAAAVSTSGPFTVRGHTALFDLSEFEPSAPHRNYDIAPDGSRFALVHQGSLSEIVMVLNWTEEVRRRSGTP